MSIMVLRAGIVEEICYRGYMIERLEKLTGNWLVYFLAPLILFGAFHYKQGVPGIIIAFVSGAILAILYLKRRDLKANIITHFLVDFIPNVVIPLVSSS
jgi:CAAX protease family protein